MLKSIQIKKATVEKDIVIAIPVKKIKGNTQKESEQRTHFKDYISTSHTIVIFNSQAKLPQI